VRIRTNEGLVGREAVTSTKTNETRRVLINGAQAIGLGALQAGCDFFAGYPITPASEILLHMIRELPKVGGTAIQAEDEIASMGLCLGAAMAGCRVMTATSGPGISLYSENIGLAIMGEVPVVIVDVQRMGPATGGATTPAQGDVQFLRWSTSGGYPVIVLSPTDAADCYRLTLQAFHLAERFRLPVFLAADKEVVQTTVSLDPADLAGPPVRERKLAPPDEKFAPYQIEDASGVPLMAAMGGLNIVRFTTSTHDERGLLTKTPAKVDRLNRRLAAKVEQHLEEIALVEADLEEGAEVLIISYGITAQAARRAAAEARRKGRRISHLVVHSLWPVPEREIRQAAHGVKRILVPELNLGQYSREIERISSDSQQVCGINRVDGELISVEEILEIGGLL
jgi:2-oxoglutarate/2-oxoacid ferredoxin oxidoreductase subunit alpha